MGSIPRLETTLDDRFESRGLAPVLLTGIQALVRLPLLQREMDAAAGLDTAGFIAGYRGSPLGGYDKELAKQKPRMDAANIVVRPGLNEDLAATAVWGSQMPGLRERAKHQGVFGIWYGKAPGVDRSGDAIRHANSAGVSPLGGVLALAGDDPTAKSSTITSGSEHFFIDLEIPMLDPADIAEVLEFGLKGIAMSRFAGLWVGLKCVADTMDAAATVTIDPARYATIAPVGLPASPDGLHIRLNDHWIAQERRQRHFKLPHAVAFARANGLNRIIIDSPTARYGIAARGKAYATLRQAMTDAGITDAMAREAGLRLWKVGLAWPLDAEAARDFARGLEEVLVIEDRRPVLEPQLREALYSLDARPRIAGKTTPEGATLLSDLGELDAPQILRAFAARLPAALRTPLLAERLAALDALNTQALAPLHSRDPYFCPGCPHNTSTRLPDGSLGLAGIGCHFLATRMDRDTELFTQMGGEGAPWLGMAPFVEEQHVFANMGDGTYAHSGSLAIRAAIASGTNITFKILVNGAVAMTGGQHTESDTSVPRIAAQLRAEGVARIAIVSDDPERHRGHALIPVGVTFDDRANLDAVQRELRATLGVTALLYDQECATERRRHRKRGTAAAATKRVVINPRICEDCGDCSRVSNCLAVEPVETAFGRKRQIDQSACNQDFSCLNGFCPSFVTLEGAEPVKPGMPAAGAALPDPAPLALRDGAWNILLAGVGGQGVTALSAILAEAAHLEGRPVRSIDQLGLAQKGGGVYAQLRLGEAGTAPESLRGPRIGQGQADLLIAADMVVAHGASARPLLAADRSVAVVNTAIAPTAQFVRDTTTRYDSAGMRASLAAATHDLITMDATKRVLGDLGDAIFVNVFLLGVAFQRGLVPLTAASIERALELNGTAVPRNKAAFADGRAAALEAPAEPEAPQTLDALIAHRAADLVAYQSARYAGGYTAFLDSIRPHASEAVLRAAAHQLHRLMAYKDEYEVARLHRDPAWQASLTARFSGTKRAVLHLAPPMLGGEDAEGRPRKRALGPWMLRAMGLLRHGRVLRGTWADPFGRTDERRAERTLPGEFRTGLETLLALGPDEAALLAWIEAWGGIRGYGPVKAERIAAARLRIAALDSAMRQARAA
ncbi:indolepyruvate ferredoxin oxidoreductase family protein [Plastoroseomonas arctica]|uniref:Indolepyruvate ferredoxin oxidoreductase family protein n=1 Tax=Plastoroseomonas arctica TaxID=1509237 RepID=A0AAF1KP63_9PROT|nr:indolepyruvate ferredoxin oxidoreductase family protein [Plastoroseomonas arctica]MBR0655453.1 indolepyruvate ferredoxin oxidoreductase family protein [Plastoroseomonas arctica]